MYLSITLLCMAIVPGFFCYEDLHKYMSPEEVRRVFHTDVDSIPEYELVKFHVPERLHKRALPLRRHFNVMAFGKYINLWLHPRDSILAGVNTPVYYAQYSPREPEAVEYRRQHGLMKMVGQIFEDPTKMASLVIGREDSGRARVNGFIGSNRIAIRSLPQRVVDEYTRRRRSIGDFEDPKNSPYHVVIRMNESLKENYSHFHVNETRLQERLSRSVGRIPYILYPEILVVVENSVYSAYDTPQGHDVYSLLEYLLAFWNGVDLKYRSVEMPRFRFHISAIVLAEEDYATPYIGRNMFDETAFDIDTAMLQSRNFFYGVRGTFPLYSYDIAATMTRYEGGLQSNILGQAYVGSACQRDDTEKTIDAVTIYSDDGVFSGVHNAAHELGHIFGAHHDIKTCEWTEGFIMAGATKYTTNTSDFSPCSLKDMQNRLKDQKLTCLYNRPRRDGENLPKLMPGRIKNLEAQCKSLTGGSSCQNKHPEHSVCMNMFCFDEQGECSKVGTKALDGTACGGKNEFCLHHRCVSL